MVDTVTMQKYVAMAVLTFRAADIPKLDLREIRLIPLPWPLSLYAREHTSKQTKL